LRRSATTRNLRISAHAINPGRAGENTLVAFLDDLAEEERVS
jgi:hypothetical protein